MLELSGRNLTVSVKIEQVEGLPQMLLCEHLIEVGACRHELRVLDESVPVEVYLFHDLHKLSLEEHLLTKMLFKALFNLLDREDAVLVHIEVLKDRQQLILLLLGAHAVRDVGQHCLLELPLTVEVLKLCQCADAERLDCLGRRTHLLADARGSTALGGEPTVDSGPSSMELLDPWIRQGFRGRDAVGGKLLKHLLNQVLGCLAHA